MNNKTSQAILSIIMISLFIISFVFATYSYFQSRTQKNNVSGATLEMRYFVEANSMYQASKLIPVSSSTVDTAVNKNSNVCRDSSDKDVCSLYEVTVTNNGLALGLTGFVRTDTSSYVTSNLKYKVYTKSGSTYTAVTDDLSVSNESGNSVYFKKGSNNVSITLSNNQSQTYYVAFWINELNSDQSNDEGKSFSCKFGFEGMNGSELTASFNV